MDEAKSLVSMTISVMINAAILAVAFGLIGIGYNVWNYFARQDLANESMHLYQHFTAFDNSTIRGQEVVELLGNNDDIFVLIYPNSVATNNPTGSNEAERRKQMSIDSLAPASDTVYVWYKNDGYNQNFDLNTLEVVNNNETCKNMLLRSKNLGSAHSADPTIRAISKKSADNNYSNIKVAEVSKADANGNIQVHSYPSADMGGSVKVECLFDKQGRTLNPDKLQALFMDPGTLGIGEGDYAAYKSTLVFADDNSNEVAGIILVKEPSVTNYTPLGVY